MSTSFAIQTKDLTRVFRQRPRPGQTSSTVTALAGVTLDVHTGELFGLLGPNGAGKTTLIKILMTLLYPTSGIALVDGLDVVRQAGELRARLGMVSGGESSGYGLLTVQEHLWMFSQFYGVPSSIARDRARRLLQVVGLWDIRDRKISTLSTGMRQKLNLCRGLISDPKLLFLDEPTLGLDVSAARDIRSYIREWLKENPQRTILLTTHYMQEADELCDRVAIINRGQILACDRPSELKRRSALGTYFQITTEHLNGVAANICNLPGVARCHITEVEGGTSLRLTLQDDSAIAAVVGAIAQSGRRILSLQKVEPTLEDVFVEIVGRRIADEEQIGA